MVAMTDLGIPGVGDATLIASGGSALVYKALSGTGEPVAIKVLRGIHGVEVARRFEREQSAAERLQGHPNIIRILHGGITAAGEPYLVMPLIGEGSLNEELEAGAFPLRKATADVAMAAEALQYAHDQGVLHRDIKPGNLLRADDGSIIVTDFGIARVVDAGITSATVGATTPLYAAPELLAENEASVHSEIYALGALLYALLNGKAAFSDSANIWASMHRIRTEAPADIPGVPEPVMHLIHHAMAKEPTNRPSSASVFVEQLRTALTAPADWTSTVEIQAGAAAAGVAVAEDPPQPPASQPPVPSPAVPSPPVPSPPASLQAPTASTTQPLPQPQVRHAEGAPPAPAYNRPVPTARSEADLERREALTKIIASVAALALIGGLSWFAVTRLLDGGGSSTEVIAPPVDNSLPSPDRTDDEPTTSDDDADDDAPGDVDGADGDEVTADDLGGDGVPNTFVSFTGDHFSALLPEGWSLLSRDVDEGYGFRSSFVAEGMYLNVDTTPSEQRDGGIDIAQSARDIASGISSASTVRTEEIDGLVMHSFTFRNREGVDSIDIFFEVDGDGYAVVAGSREDPDMVFRTARLVALSIRSNPDA